MRHTAQATGRLEAHVVDLEAFRDRPDSHLRAAWTDGVPLVVTVGDEPEIAVETIEDLEVLHRFMAFA